jgi:hypothetical protein
MTSLTLSSRNDYFVSCLRNVFVLSDYKYPSDTALCSTRILLSDACISIITLFPLSFDNTRDRVKWRVIQVVQEGVSGGTEDMAAGGTTNLAAATQTWGGKTSFANVCGVLKSSCICYLLVRRHIVYFNASDDFRYRNFIDE